jgi:hypothetical protein
MVVTCSNDWSAFCPVFIFAFSLLTHILDHIDSSLFIIANITSRIFLKLQWFLPTVVSIIFELLKSLSASFHLFFLILCCLMSTFLVSYYVTTHYTLKSTSPFVDLILERLKLLMEHRFFLFFDHIHFTLLFLS